VQKYIWNKNQIKFNNFKNNLIKIIKFLKINLENGYLFYDKKIFEIIFLKEKHLS